MSVHRAGFVHIIGKPNAGKSTLFNALIHQSLSIATHKPQTTRHNIIGIDQAENYQAIYVDTPGYFEPTYELQHAMMRSVRRALVEHDVLLWVVDVRSEKIDSLLLKHANKKEAPLLLLLNKIDRINASLLPARIARWEEALPAALIWPICALEKDQVEKLSLKITTSLPVHPPYYDKEVLTDRPKRFFAADMVRKAIFLHYKKEIPYSCEVIVEHFQDKESVIVIHVTIYVERLSQKRILIGHQGKALKGMGIQARQSLEEFFQKKVFLLTKVKILPDWRNRKDRLEKWGYQ